MLSVANNRGLNSNCPSGCEKSLAHPAVGQSWLWDPSQECHQGPRFFPSFCFAPTLYTHFAPHSCHDYREVTHVQPCLYQWEGVSLPLTSSEQVSVFLDGTILCQTLQAGKCCGGLAEAWLTRTHLYWKFRVSLWVLLSRERKKCLLQASDKVMKTMPHLPTCQLCIRLLKDSPIPWQLSFFVLEKEHSSFPERSCVLLLNFSALLYCEFTQEVQWSNTGDKLWLLVAIL